MQDQRSETLKRQRESFLAILDAITPTASTQALLAHRVDAKQAQAALLQLGQFGTDQSHATRARWQARTYREHCASLLLDS